MNAYLLDTSVVLKWAIHPASLSQEARLAIANGRNTIYISAVVAWEIAIKEKLGKISGGADVSALMKANRFTELAVGVAHAQATKALPSIHRDPFDRMLIAQAQVESLILITEDRAIMQYDVQTLRA